MGFQIVTHAISLSREQLIQLLIDNQNVKTTTSEGETVMLIGSGNYTKESNIVGSGLIHKFFTNMDHNGDYLWVQVVLTSSDNQVFQGTIFYKNYPDDNLGE